MKERIQIQDTTLIGNWEEVAGMRLSEITRKDGDDAVLDGLVIRGYETKFGVTNENGERYQPGCLDRFVQSYFIEHGLNMVVDVQHGYGIDDQVGRVIYMETNSVGFYFVAYVPKTVRRYDQVRDLLREGILQGFSKCGYATDFEWAKDRDGEEYFLVKEMQIVSVSLVTSPANPIPFEEVGEIRNKLEYRNTFQKKKKAILKSRQ